jgi:predicted alpha/beta-hydrolase family hydrolase
VFLSGTRDAFATPAELEAATAGIHAPVTHFWLEGCDHGLRGQDATVAGQIAGWLGGIS